MAIKPKFFKHVAAAGVIDCVPREFGSIVNPKGLVEPYYAVICFPGMRNSSSSIVDSRAIEKALCKNRFEGGPLAAVAHNFTAEALEILASHNAVVFTVSNFYWTDESWANIRDK